MRSGVPSPTVVEGDGAIVLRLGKITLAEKDALDFVLHDNSLVDKLVKLIVPLALPALNVARAVDRRPSASVAVGVPAELGVVPRRGAVVMVTTQRHPRLLRGVLVDQAARQQVRSHQDN